MAELKLKKIREEKKAFAGIDLILAREAAGLSQTELAERCGWYQQKIWRLEQMEVCEDAETIETLQRALGE